jgi:parallel beta-helix repeat protein
MSRSGTSANPIVFMRYPGDAMPKLDGKDAVTWVVRFSSVSNVKLIGFEVTRGYLPNMQDGGGVLITQSSSIVVADSVLHDNSAYGVKLYNSTNSTVEGNDIYRNGGGVDVRRGGAGVKILNNDIHDQNRCMGPGTCAVAVGFVKSDGAVLAKGNRIWGNRAPSPEYGIDGGGFEIYGASNVTMTENILWDNDNTVETGTDNGVPCANNVFTRNVASGPSPGNYTVGLVLRCGENMLIAHNTIIDVSYYVYDINLSSKYSHKVDGLRIINNVVRMNNGKIYGFVGTNLPLSTMTVDYNLDYNPGNLVASVTGKGNASTTTRLTEWTGFQANGVNADPRFVDPAAKDYRLRADSPALDRGTILPTWSAGFKGSAPDMGRFER